jgi:hypothetical protein
MARVSSVELSSTRRTTSSAYSRARAIQCSRRSAEFQVMPVTLSVGREIAASDRSGTAPTLATGPAPLSSKTAAASL